MSTFISRYIKFFFIADFLLILAHILGKQYWLVNLDIEYNIPTLFSSVQIFLVALVIGQIFLREQNHLKDIVPGNWIWLLLGAAFAFLAIDDVAQIHERFLRREVQDLLPPDSLWISLMPWQIIFGPLLAIIGITVLVVIFTRFSQEQRLFLPAVLALGCWVLAVALEGLSKPFFMVQGWYPFEVLLEEGLELFGGTFFLLCFARYGKAIEADYRPESFSGRSGYIVFKAATVLLLFIGAGSALVFFATVHNSSWLYRHNGGVLMQRGKYDRAIVALKQALAENPDDVPALNLLGDAYSQSKDYPAALASYEKSLSLAPNQPQVQRAAQQLKGTATNGNSVTNELHEVKTTDHLATLDNPSEDGWDTEAFAILGHKQLKHIGKLLKKKRPLKASDFASIAAPDFTCEPLVPENLKAVFRGDALTVKRGHSDGTSKSFSGPQGLADAINQMLAPLQSAESVHSKFKIFRVNQDGSATETRAYGACSGRVGDKMVEQNATWTIQWTPPANKKLPLIKSIVVDDFEMVESTPASGPLFADCTDAVLQANTSYTSQLLRGFQHWLQTSQRRRHLFRLGTPGIAIADVNGDGLEDLYLCQEVGLPNRLFLHQENNTLVDVSKEWEADWLHDSRSALFFDWDNDGDQDLAVSVLGGVLLAENDGGQRFKFHTVLPTSDDTMSLAAADYDQDGDLDFYVCVYRMDQKTTGEMPSLLPGSASTFVQHDANNGGPNALFRNDGNGNFADVTQATGMNQNNSRFSYAASWDDFDNDGDVDLYVANDFGRDNFYRNDEGSFVDIAEQANVEDRAGGMGITWGDYNHDGWMDAYVSNMWSSAGNRVTFQEQFKTDSPEVKRRLQGQARGNTLLKNLGDGRFEHVSAEAAVEVGRWAWGCHFFDLNNDSWEDLMVANGFITTENSHDL